MFKKLSLVASLLLVNNYLIAPVFADITGPLPISLKGVPIPPVPGLLDGNNPIIVDRDMAIALGKALFWDTAVGSDGYACASCHFSAGADTRSKNQLAPGGKFSTLSTATTFQTTASGNKGGANYTVKKSDFPFFQMSDPLDPGSNIIFSSDDVMGSSGTFAGLYSAIIPGNYALSGATDSTDVCARSVDPVFHVGATGTRKVTPRNAPTVINSIFNHRNFWDGRANNVFNGSNNWGDRDPNAGVWVKTSLTTVKKQRLELINSSIASLATAPPLNDTEMSCTNRTFKDLARKLLNRYALAGQTVHYEDSALCQYSNSSNNPDPNNLQQGLFFNYMDMIGMAFNPDYWSYPQRGAFGAPAQVGAIPYTQIEANFPMFFGLSIQMYLSTLVSDQSPFDQSPRDKNGLPTTFTGSQLNGLNVFVEQHCSECHIGATFTTASVATNAQLVQTNPNAFGVGTPNPIRTSANVISRKASLAGITLMDTGFSNDGTADDGADLGLGGVDDFGHPLSFSLQYLQYLAGNSAGVYDVSVSTIKPCNFQIPFALNVTSNIPSTFTQADGIIANATSGCITPAWAYQPTVSAVKKQLVYPNSLKALAVVNGIFKIPSLRNVELTGPYMHNGSMSTLDQVIEMYTRGGNFSPPGLDFSGVFPNGDLQVSQQSRTDLVNFLQTLTDNRVRYQQAPFDHPSLTISTGQVGNNVSVSSGNPIASSLAQDQTIVINAVGANGSSSPLLPFSQTLQ